MGSSPRGQHETNPALCLALRAGFPTQLNYWVLLDPVQTTPEEFEKGGFILKTCQMFSVHTTPEEFKKQQSPVIFDLRLWKTWSGNSHDYRLCFRKAPFS